jgi:glycosyltransferase involved in cell wall biosynthesis
MAENRDILILCQYFYPEYISSATIPFATARSLAEAGYNVDVLCGYPREYSTAGSVARKEIVSKINILRLPYIQSERTNFLGRLINFSSFFMVASLRFTRLRNYKAIIVYSNPPVLPLLGALANKFFGNKFVFVCYDVYPEIAEVTKAIHTSSLSSSLMRYVNAIVFRHASRVVAVSQDMKEFLLRHRASIAPGDIEVIPNWYEQATNAHVPSGSISIEWLKNLNSRSDFIVSYFGNIGVCQDLDTILDAMRLLRDQHNIKFLFAVHGVKVARLVEIVRDEQLDNALVLPYLHGSDFEHALNVSDCFIVSWVDGMQGLAFPSKTYCYMSAGKPIIAVMGLACDLAKELKDNCAGYAVEIGDAARLVAVINELKDNPCVAADMGANVQRLFLDRYTAAQSTERYVRMIKKLLEE